MVDAHKEREDEKVIAKFHQLFLEAVVASMIVVRKFQIGELTLSELAEVKKDGTLKGECDVRSGEAAKTLLKDLPPDLFELKFEDIEGRENDSGARFRLDNDNLDGTRIFTNGGTSSTVILGVYDKVAERYTASYVGEPVSGRIWFADLANQTQLIVFDYWNEWFLAPRDVHVCSGRIDEQATIFIDTFEEGFPLNLRQYYKLERLVAKLGSRKGNPRQGAHIINPGSNGYHQALVANGGQGAIGGIMTAMGGPHDSAGFPLVLQSGGSGIGLKEEGDGQLSRQNPLNPHSFKMLVWANTEYSAHLLARAVEESYKQ